MTDYKELYHLLFNKITDIVDELQQIQRMAEELYVESELDRELDETEQNKKSVQ